MRAVTRHSEEERDRYTAGSSRALASRHTHETRPSFGAPTRRALAGLPACLPACLPFLFSLFLPPVSFSPSLSLLLSLFCISLSFSHGARTRSLGGASEKEREIESCERLHDYYRHAKETDAKGKERKGSRGRERERERGKGKREREKKTRGV